MDLYQYGWSDDFCGDDGIDLNSVARVISVHRGVYKMVSKAGELNGYLSGKLHHLAMEQGIAVGDWCVLSPSFIDEQNKAAALVEQLLPRRSKISRVASGTTSAEQVIVANVDYAFIVTSANADLNINRLHRYILLAEEGRVRPVVVLSKVDLMSDYLDTVDQLKQKFPNIEVVGVSAESSIGLDVLMSFIGEEGVSGVFLGSSGVGKSTLVNRILGRDIQATKTIREDDAKGQHTTTYRELFLMANGGMIIDTPGLREIQVFGDQQIMKSAFSKIEELGSLCKYNDCSHVNEPGCAILAALSSGELDSKEMASYQKLQREIEYSNRKMDKRYSSNQKKKWKTINQNMRKRRKFEGR